MKDENLKKLRSVIDRLDNIIQMSKNNLPAEIHWEGVKDCFPELRKEIFDVYIDEDG